MRIGNYKLLQWTFQGLNEIHDSVGKALRTANQDCITSKSHALLARVQSQTPKEVGIVVFHWSLGLHAG